MFGIIVDYKKNSKKLSYYDNPNAKEIIKIGKEINLYKRLDRANHKDIEKKFGKEANNIIKPKEDKEFISNLTRDINKEMKKQLKGGK